jgi:hypothetical protein
MFKMYSACVFNFLNSVLSDHIIRGIPFDKIVQISQVIGGEAVIKLVATFSILSQAECSAGETTGQIVLLCNNTKIVLLL